MAKNYQVIIVGSGVSGSSLAYLLAQFSDLDNIAVLDKLEVVAGLNSDSKYNSQTLHCGDIETNYTLEKAKKVYQASDLVRKYAKSQPDHDKIIFSTSKMLIGVGDTEVKKIHARHKLFSKDFPYMKLLDQQQIADLEPNVAKNRSEPIAAMGVDTDTCAVDFGKLAHSFIKNASTTKKRVDILLGHHLKSIKRTGKSYQLSVQADNTELTFSADFVVFSTGAYSLTYAKSMGYGQNYSLLAVAGSFYFSQQALNGKVYTIQNDKLPFAAVHGDPDVNFEGQTRFGPTALIMPKLERYRNDTYWDYLQVLDLDKAVFKALGKLIFDADIFRYISRNFAFEIPILGRNLFAKDVQKIIPSLKPEALKFAKGFGGLRPQIIDKEQEKLVLGEAHIGTDEGLIFNITPSPGASTCLNNSLKDAAKICCYLGVKFDQAKFKKSIK